MNHPVILHVKVSVLKPVTEHVWDRALRSVLINVAWSALEIAVVIVMFHVITHVGKKPVPGVVLHVQETAIKYAPVDVILDAPMVALAAVQIVRNYAQVDVIHRVVHRA